jgi:hypothetical protein
MRVQITSEKRQLKLGQLVETEGYPNLEDLLRDATFDSVCPGICLSDGCDYTTEVEPDQDRGWCECCCDNTVASGLVLAAII